ncbi:MAG: UbiA family prenyltransferase [Pseudomonadota bacterium]
MSTKGLMKPASLQDSFAGISRLKLYLALSRTPHVLLDMATPAFGALLWLGAIPSLKVTLLGLITAFAGYTAVYALNDILDHRVDRVQYQEDGFSDLKNYLDALLVRHPIAQGLLTLRESLTWVAAWSMVALIGAYALNPVCALIFIAGSLLEASYCLLWEVSSFRTVISGVVKTSGGIAAVFAVDPSPSPFFLAALFLWIFLWEVGGQNIPADWADIERDSRSQAKTIPVLCGPARANALSLYCLVLVVLINLFLFRLTPGGFEIYDAGICFFAGVYLLILPAYRLLKSRNRLDALKLFNRACYYPLTLFVVVGIRSII